MEPKPSSFFTSIIVDATKEPDEAGIVRVGSIGISDVYEVVDKDRLFRWTFRLMPGGDFHLVAANPFFVVYRFFEDEDPFFWGLARDMSSAKEEAETANRIMRRREAAQ